MPRDVTVEFEDGSSIQYKNTPDKVTPEEVTAQAERESGLRVVSLDGGRPGPLKTAGRVGALAATNVAEGALAMPALMADSAEKYGSHIPGIPGAIILAGQKAKQALYPESISGSGNLYEKASGIGMEPKTTAEKYIAAGAQGAGGALTGGSVVAAPVRTIGGGIVAGLSGEAGAQAVGEQSSAAPFMRILASLLGGGIFGAGAHMVQRTRPQSANLAKEAVEGITQKHFTEAQSLMQNARAKGVDMTLDQALVAVGVPASNLTTIKNALAKSRSGNEVQATLNRQSGQLENLADTEVAKIPGPNTWTTGDSANAVQDTATKLLENAKRARTQAVRDDYAKAGALPPEARGILLNVIDKVSNKPGSTDALKAVAADLKKKLAGQDAEAAIEAAKKAVLEAAPGKGRAQATVALQKALREAESAVEKPLHALDVDVAISDAMGAYKGTPTYLANPQATGQVKGLGKALNAEFKALSPEVRAAEAKFERLSNEIVNPLKKSVIGRLATPRGALADREAGTAALQRIFDKGSDSQTSLNEITELGVKLGRVDKEAFPAAFKTYLRDKLGAVIESSPGKTVADSSTGGENASRVYNALFRSRAQLNGLGNATEVVARSYGKDPKAARAGLENLAQIIKGLTNRPDRVGGISDEEIRILSGSSATANAVRLYGFLPLEKAARGMESRDIERTFKEFDRILTTPEGADLLQKLAKVPVMSSKAITLLSTFGATVGSAEKSGDGQEESKPSGNTNP